MKFTKLQTRHEKGHSPKGEEAILAILSAAAKVLVEHGYGAFTLRKISQAAGMSLGNVSYYYKTKQLLLSDLLDAVIQRYIGVFDGIRHNPSLSDAEKFKRIIEEIVLDYERKETTRFFPELWALANHNEDAAKGMDMLYERARGSLDDLIHRLNPDLPKKQKDLLSLFISASLEGQTMFVGYKKYNADKRADIARLASETFLNMVLNAKPADT